MSLNAPLDRSSDKSSDSGGLLSLSSLALSEGEGSWLLAMKDMKFIEEEEIPDDLLNISQESLSDADEDSLNEPEATKLTDEPLPLLEDIVCDDNTRTSPSPHMVQNSPNTHTTNQPLTVPSRCSEPTSDAQTLMDDFGFNINVSAPHTYSDSPCILMDEREEKEDAPIDLASILMGEKEEEEMAPANLAPSPEEPTTTTHEPFVGEKEDAPNDLASSPPEPTVTVAPQSLLDDFGFNIRLSTPHKGRGSPNKAHRRGDRSLEVSPSTEQKTKYLMKFDADLSTTHTKKKLSPVNWSPIKAQILLEFDSTLAALDAGTPLTTEPGASLLSTEKNSDGQNLLDDFGFRTDLSIGKSSTEQRSEAQNLLDDFGFESITSAPHNIGKGMDLPNTDAVVDASLIAPPSTAENSDTSTLLDDFGFDINLSASRKTKTVTPDTCTTDNCSALPSGDGKPPKKQELVPLIAFNEDTVRLWEAKEIEDKSHATHSNQSPSPAKAHDQMQDQAPDEDRTHSSDKLDAVGRSVDRTMILEKNGDDDAVGGCSVGEDEETDGTSSAERGNQSRLPTPSEQLTKYSSSVRSPIKCSQLEELRTQKNITFTLSNSSSPDQDNGDTSVQPISSDSVLSAVKSNSSVVSSTDNEEIHKTDPQSLDSSISSEHSQASSISSVASVKESSRGGGPFGGDTGRTAAARANVRKVGGKIPKPVSKNRPNIKPSLLPSKSATTLSKAPGAISKLHVPSSRLARPKSVSNPSVKNGFSKPSEMKQPKSRLTTTSSFMTNRTSKLAKPVSGDTVKQSAVQRVPGQPRSKMVAPSAAVRRKKVVGGTSENPTAARRQPLTASTPIGPSSESGGGSVQVSPQADARANETFVVNSTATATVSSSSPTGTTSTPKTRKGGRRSLIPTPSHDKKTQRPRQVRDAAVGGGTGVSVGGAIPSRVFKPRNGPNQTNGYGTVKSKGIGISFGGGTDLLTLGGSKLAHSPADKENRPATPHSKWSPIRKKKPLNWEEACIRCTKKVK